MRTRTLWSLSLLLTVVVVVVALVVHDPPRPAPTVPTRPMASSATSRALDVLRAWDRRRAAAWAADDRAAVRALYVVGSDAGRHDLAMLAAYHRRGLRVTAMQRQVLSVEVHARSQRSLSLVVTDRLSRARVRGQGASYALPHSSPATRRILMRRVGDDWRVAGVYDD